MTHSDAPWTTADEWFAEFIERLETSPSRRRRLWRERVEIPVRDALARSFEEKTEQLRRMIAVERERWLAELGKTA